MRQQETKPVQLLNDVASNENEKYYWRDVFWAIFFYITLVTHFILACMHFRKSENVNKDVHFTWNETFTKQILVSCATSIVFTALWMFIIIKCASCIIKFCLVIFPVAFVIFAVITFLAGSIVLGCMFLIISVFSAIYCYFSWKRVPFATASIKIAVIAFQQFHAPLIVNILMVFVTVQLIDTHIFYILIYLFLIIFILKK